MTYEERELVTGASIMSVFLPNEKNTWDPVIMAICIEKSEKMDTKKFEVFHIPAATWAIFECTPDPESVQNVTRRIWTEWYPSTGYEHDWKPEIEAYFPAGTGKPPAHCQVWHPVIKKN